MTTTHFDGMTALVTGAGGGFGRAISAELAAGGAYVAVVDRDAASGQQTVDEIAAAGGSATLNVVDLTDPDAVANMVSDLVKDRGRLDVAVNNAGIGGDMVPLAEYPVDTWRHVMDVNLNSVFYCLRAELAAMVDLGARGSIINTASIMSTVAMPTISAYVAAKHGVLGLTRAAAVEYGPHGIRVNAVGPSFSRVGFTADKIDDDAQWEAMAAQHPLGRTASPRDVAGTMAFLASDAAAFTTGQLFLVDGGYTAQ
ncbi:SDR family NAD(P)-dependent oxidoreductase [Gordonia rhizosphera]|uniref:Putative gluconate 5-dehydrogenase n=1 Tax=Gordonia rhizosphera NBRC 16068 TaxID=1108045 RepID=K6VY37_9ACTN|nr:SDR family NAD(P)-dependent oxidoreductase [Gordonia rhizosphera]GAB91790.1 putative gluconate 5-dehydrogenase [Gordonia rhizosphera NBRC 16068]